MLKTAKSSERYRWQPAEETLDSLMDDDLDDSLSRDDYSGMDLSDNKYAGATGGKQDVPIQMFRRTRQN
jgi:hypothetical protein